MWKSTWKQKETIINFIEGFIYDKIKDKDEFDLLIEYIYILYRQRERNNKIIKGIDKYKWL